MFTKNNKNTVFSYGFIFLMFQSILFVNFSNAGRDEFILGNLPILIINEQGEEQIAFINDLPRLWFFQSITTPIPTQVSSPSIEEYVQRMIAWIHLHQLGISVPISISSSIENEIQRTISW